MISNYENSATYVGKNRSYFNMKCINIGEDILLYIDPRDHAVSLGISGCELPFSSKDEMLKFAKFIKEMNQGYSVRIEDCKFFGCLYAGDIIDDKIQKSVIFTLFYHHEYEVEVCMKHLYFNANECHKIADKLENTLNNM